MKKLLSLFVQSSLLLACFVLLNPVVKAEETVAQPAAFVVDENGEEIPVVEVNYDYGYGGGYVQRQVPVPQYYVPQPRYYEPQPKRARSNCWEVETTCSRNDRYGYGYTVPCIVTRCSNFYNY